MNGDWPEKPGAKRIVITEIGEDRFSVRRETWVDMPGIAPAPFYHWDEDEGTYEVFTGILSAIATARNLLSDHD
jgi:hypothetical protein